jgi:hypothetical protein
VFIHISELTRIVIYHNSIQGWLKAKAIQRQLLLSIAYFIRNFVFNLKVAHCSPSLVYVYILASSNRLPMIKTLRKIALGTLAITAVIALFATGPEVAQLWSQVANAQLNLPPEDHEIETQINGEIATHHPEPIPFYPPSEIYAPPEIGQGIQDNTLHPHR